MSISDVTQLVMNNIISNQDARDLLRGYNEEFESLSPQAPEPEPEPQPAIGE